MTLYADLTEHKDTSSVWVAMDAVLSLSQSLEDVDSLVGKDLQGGSLEGNFPESVTEGLRED